MFTHTGSIQTWIDLRRSLPNYSWNGERAINKRWISSKLGKGGIGEVWHAYDLRLRVDVALKSLCLNLRKNPTYVELLGREVRSAREVVSPNVCRIFDLVVVDRD